MVLPMLLAFFFVASAFATSPVRPAETPSDISCGPNQEYTPSKRPCPPESCFTLYYQVPCAPFPVDYVPPPGCVCRSGYLRDDNDLCIPIEQCPPPPQPQPVCNGPNEVATDNSILCPPQTCDSLYKGYACLPRDPVAGCKCIDGHLRNANGTCIPNEQCPPAPKPEISCAENEVYSDNKITCPPQSCESIYTTYSCAAKPIEEKNPGCNCIDGYLRDANQVCIPSEKCPGATPQCNENEVYTDRKISCPPQSCLAASGLINYLCAMEEPRPGCICKDNYLRDENDVCIPSKECPPGRFKGRKFTKKTEPVE